MKYPFSSFAAIFHHMAQCIVFVHSRETIDSPARVFYRVDTYVSDLFISIWFFDDWGRVVLTCLSLVEESYLTDAFIPAWYRNYTGYTEDVVNDRSTYTPICRWHAAVCNVTTERYAQYRAAYRQVHIPIPITSFRSPPRPHRFYPHPTQSPSHLSPSSPHPTVSPSPNRSDVTLNRPHIARRAADIALLLPQSWKGFSWTHNLHAGQWVRQRPQACVAQVRPPTFYPQGWRSFAASPWAFVWVASELLLETGFNGISEWNFNKIRFYNA